MRILLSWIAFNNDMTEVKDNRQYRGPTLKILRHYNFDVLHLFYGDRKGEEIAGNLRMFVNKDQKRFEEGLKKERDFNVGQIILQDLPLANPTDYKNLWKKVPEKVEKILSKYKKDDNEIFINLSAGTPAMSSTWMMMVGTGQLKATLLNPQFDRELELETLDTVDTGIYPFVREIENKIDRDLGIIQHFESEEMKDLYSHMHVLSRKSKKTILLRGERGTGKTRLAEDIHNMSNRSEKPFIELPCKALEGADNLTVQTLVFGSVEGIATGTKDNKGYFGQVEGGTLFLDEFGDISISSQSLLIQALVTKKYTPLGAEKEKQGDFQVILATNYDLEKMVADGEMRQDFYDRFRGLEYTIPPLRERPEDIPILVDSLLKGPNYPDLELDEKSLEYLISSLQELRLPNNVRGIEDILEVLEQESELIKPNPISPEIIEEIIVEKDSPTKHDDFATTVKQTVDQWTQTKDGKSGKKWWDGVLDTALNELLKSDEYLKNNGGLHYYKLSQKLGVDQKTIKNRIEKQTKSAL